jgi:hypothetical protein
MATLTKIFPCFFLSCKANVRENPAKTGHGPHSSYFLCCCMYCLFCVVLCIVCVYMCTELLPPGGYPIAVNKYIISYVSVYIAVIIRLHTYACRLKANNCDIKRHKIILQPKSQKCYIIILRHGKRNVSNERWARKRL